MIHRDAEQELRLLAQQFRAVVVTGPRQAGKTTLVRKVFDAKPYVSLENPDVRKFALEDPRGFLSGFPHGAVLDEVQRAPELFSYLQQILDERNEAGLFILTGSNNFLLQESISQSLAGRTGTLFLLPLGLNELALSDSNSNLRIIQGGFPAIHAAKTDVGRFYANYIRTYVERDVRLLRNISDLYAFERFLRLCAGRVGQLLNMNSLATETGVDMKTVASWIGILETSFVLFRLQPYHKNFSKRIVKTPKLYFYDTGLAASLLGISSANDLSVSPYRGNLFENLVVLEFLKNQINFGKTTRLYFWRDNTGHEVDLLLDSGKALLPVEVKSGKTIIHDFFSGVRYWMKLTGAPRAWIIYDGEEWQNRSDGCSVVPLRDLPSAKIV
ncbi:MAG: ATP-binding protein [Bacteroidales bacterium]